MFEINLVPDIKEQMIKTLKLRNLILFICIVVAAAAGGVILFLLTVKGGQDIRMSTQDTVLAQMSKTLNSYEDLGELLTLKGQINKLDEIGQKKKVFSRVFSIIETMLPTNTDKITISELTVDLTQNTLKIEGQADAGEDNIDYRVLEAFKKSTAVMKFDYGRFVDKEGREIPTRCIEETDAEGNKYEDKDGLYVMWNKGEKGCDPAKAEEDVKKAEEQVKEKTEAGEENVETPNVVEEEIEPVKIWRTPQFKKWSKSGFVDDQGKITKVEHFESACLTYTKVSDGTADGVKWVDENVCDLTTGDRVEIGDDSVNARNEQGKLVLKFSATIYLDERVLSFANKHMMSIAPSGRKNVTDSYLQIEGMFEKAAQECAADDTACIQNKENTGE